MPGFLKLFVNLVCQFEKMKNYDNIIFKSPTRFSEPQTGSLLISQPFLEDRPFRHSVVLLTELDSNGAFSGFVMNKKTGYCLSDFVDISDKRCDMPLYCGGPVSTDHLFFIHSLDSLLDGGIAINDRMRFGGNFEQLISYINSGIDLSGKVRFFLGYSGWGSHQLIEEIKELFWAVNDDYPVDDLFSGEGDSYWHRQVRRLGEDFRNWLYHPLNPQSN